MRAAVEQGHYISFSGIVTFKNAKEIQAIAIETPSDFILIETDAPYLAPTPYRGKPCEPYMIAATVKKAADLRGEDPQAFAEQTRQNAQRVFGLPIVNG